MTAISGENANFLAGGEFPIPAGYTCDPVTARTCQYQIQFKKFGVGLNFTPVVLAEGRISLKVMTEVSELSNENQLTLAQSLGASSTTLTIPSIKTRRAETTVEIPSGGSLAMAGMIAEQTKQQLNGIPGLMQLPILGALFKSRDYVNRQTELMVIVTPYIVRAVAQKELSRPDDGYADASDPASILIGRFNRIYGAAGSADPQGHLSRQARLHSRLTPAPGRRTMRSNYLRSPSAAPAPHRPGARAPRLRRAAFRLLHDRPGGEPGGLRLSPAAPDRDQGGARTVELFIGNNRGGLNGDQRADVVALATTWRQRATGGIVIELPSGTRNEIAAANALHEVRSILAAAGVPPHAMEVRPYRPIDPGKLASLRLNYSTMIAEAGSLRPVARRSRTHLRSPAQREHAVLEFTAARTQRNLAAMVDNKADLMQPRGEVPPYTGRRTTVLDKYHRGESTATVYPDQDKGKISELGK